MRYNYSNTKALMLSKKISYTFYTIISTRSPYPNREHVGTAQLQTTFCFFYYVCVLLSHDCISADNNVCNQSSNYQK